MIKGAQKKMIVMKTSYSDLFEEAYFVLRRENRAEEEDMVEEANRIIESVGGKKRSVKRIYNKEWLFGVGGCIAGALFGGGAVALILLA